MDFAVQADEMTLSIFFQVDEWNESYWEDKLEKNMLNACQQKWSSAPTGIILSLKWSHHSFIGDTNKFLFRLQGTGADLLTPGFVLLDFYVLCKSVEWVSRGGTEQAWVCFWRKSEDWPKQNNQNTINNAFPISGSVLFLLPLPSPFSPLRLPCLLLFAGGKPLCQERAPALCLQRTHVPLPSFPL